jgi:transposase-like protein
VHTSDIQFPSAGRRRGRYSDEFKRKVISACKQPGVSTAAVALANGLNANLLRRWISEPQGCLSKPATAKQTKALTIATQTQFIPLDFQANGAAPANIRIELQRADTTIRVQWPLGYAGECATWMREVLK